MQKKILMLVAILLIAGSFYFVFGNKKASFTDTAKDTLDSLEKAGENLGLVNPLSIEYMRKQEYPGSDIAIEQALPSISNYNRYIVSYKSDGLKIYALLTVPFGDPPERGSASPQGGWPVIVFNHGFIQPSEYRTTERYVAYVDAFAKNGYIVLKPDYRGHGNSEGEATGGYGSPAYTIDILNAVSSIKKLIKSSFGNDAGQASMTDELLVDVNRIGMWGHSMGGHITIRSMVISKDIKAGVIWAGVVASYPDLINRWRRGTITPPPLPTGARRWRQTLVEQYGSPEQNPAFWNSISANSFLKDISGPIQLHHGTADTSVPIEFSEKLDSELKAASKESEIFIYEGDDHNIANNFNIAIQRSVDFFDKYLK